MICDDLFSFLSQSNKLSYFRTTETILFQRLNIAHLAE